MSRDSSEQSAASVLRRAVAAMRSPGTILLLTLLTGCATLSTGPLPPIPKRFDHTYPGMKIVTIADRSELNRLCLSMHNLNGCAFRHLRGGCTILVSANPIGMSRAYVIRHEQAHCNGWPADHSA